MEASELLIDTFGRIREMYLDTAKELSAEEAHWRPQGTGNSVAWLLWHLARTQDDHVAGLDDDPQTWNQGWSERFNLPFDPDDIGYGHSPEQVDATRIDDLDALVEYHGVVHERTLDYLRRVDAEELDRIVDRRWDPPVTAGVRIVSLLGDCVAHLGQAGYVRGLPRSP